MSTVQNRAIALRFLDEGWGAKPNWQAVWDEIVDANVVHHFNSEPEPIVGLEPNKAFNVSLFEGFPDIEHTVEDILAEDDKVVYRTTLRGTHAGNFLGIPPTGKSAQLNDFTLLRMADNKIVEWWYDCNLLALMQQLGVSA